MYVRNDTNVPVLYTVMVGEVVRGTILPGQTLEIPSPAGADHVSFSADDGTVLPAGLSVLLALR